MSRRNTAQRKEPTKAEIEEENARLRAELAAAKQQTSTDAKDNPVIIHRTLEPLEEQIGQDSVVTGQDDSPEIIKPKAQSVDDPFFTEKMANLAFMEEMVTVYIQPTSDKLAPKYFAIYVNGEMEVFHYGQSKTVKRKFVEGLMRAKPTAYRNEEFTRNDGVMDVRWPSSTGLRYNFSITKDDNPLSGAWMKSVLAQP